MASIYVVPTEYHKKTKEFMRGIARSISPERQDLAALFLLGDSFNTYILARDILMADGLILEDIPAQQELPGMELKGINKVRNMKPHPALRIATDSHAQVTKLLIEFNLTPKSRKKPEPAPMEQPEPEESTPIDRFVVKKNVANG